jgi:hypothetical protein
MTGHKIKLGKTARIKDGKVIVQPIYHDASAAIRARKSKKVKPCKRSI